MIPEHREQLASQVSRNIFNHGVLDINPLAVCAWHYQQRTCCQLWQQSKRAHDLGLFTSHHIWNLALQSITEHKSLLELKALLNSLGGKENSALNNTFYDIV